MGIEVRCDNGHVFHVKSRYAGAAGLCPTCKATVVVPNAPVGLSENAILRILQEGVQTRDSDISAGDGPDCADDGLQGSTPRVSRAILTESKTCPRCKNSVRVAYHMCPHCRMYFSDPLEVARRLKGA